VFEGVFNPPGAIEADHTDGQVSETREGMVGVPRVGWVGILPPSGIAGVVDFVFDAPVPRTWAWRYAGVAFPLDVLVSMSAYSRLILFPMRSNSSRRMTPAVAACGKSIPSAALAQVLQFLILPRPRSST
jgi:hypothetical protein